MHVFTFFLKVRFHWISLGIIQWNFTKRDHPGNPGRVFELGLVNIPLRVKLIGQFIRKRPTRTHCRVVYCSTSSS